MPSSRRLRAPTLSRCDRSARLSPALRCVPRFTARFALRRFSRARGWLFTFPPNVGVNRLSCPRRHGHNDARRRSDRDRDRIDRPPRERCPAPATRGAFPRPMPFDPGTPLRGPLSRASSSALLCRTAPAPDVAFWKPVARPLEAPVHPNMVVSGFSGSATPSIDFCHETRRGRTLRTTGTPSKARSTLAMPPCWTLPSHRARGCSTSPCGAPCRSRTSSRGGNCLRRCQNPGSPYRGHPPSPTRTCKASRASSPRAGRRLTLPRTPREGSTLRSEPGCLPS